MHLLETRLKLLLALRPCSEVKITSSYTWDALFTSPISDELRIVQTSVSTARLITLLNCRRDDTR